MALRERGGEGKSEHTATSRPSRAKHMSGVCHRKFYPGAAGQPESALKQEVA